MIDFKTVDGLLGAYGEMLGVEAASVVEVMVGDPVYADDLDDLQNALACIANDASHADHIRDDALGALMASLHDLIWSRANTAASKAPTLDVADAHSELIVRSLRAIATWNPDGAADVAAWVAIAVRNHVKTLVAKEYRRAAPLSLPGDDLGRTIDTNGALPAADPFTGSGLGEGSFCERLQGLAHAANTGQDVVFGSPVAHHLASATSPRMLCSPDAYVQSLP